MSSQSYDADGRERGDTRRASPIVFVTDAAEESSRVADKLRSAGYLVVDVPLSMLVARAQVQRPDVVLVDVDVPSALDEVDALRRFDDEISEFVFVGSGAGPIKSARHGMDYGGVFFSRPLDMAELVEHIATITGGPVVRPEGLGAPPPSSVSSRPPARLGTVPPDRPSAPLLPSPGVRGSAPPLPLSVPSLAEFTDPPPRSLASLGSVSSELSQLLADAELRAELMLRADAPLPSPEEEIESVLPADVLAALDEPLEGDEAEDAEHRPILEGADQGTGHGTGLQGKATTSGGSKLTTSSGRVTSHSTFPKRLGSDTPAWEIPLDRRKTGEWSAKADEDGAMRLTPLEDSVSLAANIDPPESDGERVPLLVSSAAPEVLRPSQTPSRGPSEAPARAALGSVVLLRTVDTRRYFAEAIAARRSGSLCFEHDGVVRRIVLRDGDFVTAASGADSESLVCFLGARGELPRDEVERLSGKIPPYGRHAGAALVAHGWLGQDQLWGVLRAHSEWIAETVLGLERGTAQLEAEPPGRLRSEPSVFAAKAGAEIFVELVRRVVSPEEAMDALGGEASRIGDGVVPSLLAECALAPQELDLVTRGRGGTMGALAARSPAAEIVAVIHALHLLGVLDVIPAIVPSESSAGAELDAEGAALDEEATRARIRARLELVDEGDYFSLLGVRREATSYEVRRAFVELRRTFEPTRILTPRTVDLSEDVRKIVVVLEEAYEVLRDTARRERYRRAIEARPD